MNEARIEAIVFCVLCGYSRKETAKLLGLSVRQIYRELEKLRRAANRKRE